jgi:hypothetical protein
MDLVVCRPAGIRPENPIHFRDLQLQYNIALNETELESLKSLPPLISAPVGDVLIALEAKAVMTAHVRAASRLYDELSSAAQCQNGGAPNALAIAHAIVNVSDKWISPDRNEFERGALPVRVSNDRQPRCFQKALETIRNLSVRGYPTERGFDGLAVTMLQGINDGSPFAVAPIPPSLTSSDPLNYERMILRVSGLYSGRFASL